MALAQAAGGGRLSREKLVIIGAGPAGLAAAAAARSLEPVVIEVGSVVGNRSQSESKDLVQGVGGAGLYSDGKFSFWPSGSGLWRLDGDLLERSYQWFREIVSDIGIVAPSLPSTHTAQISPDADGFEKRYSSAYATFDARLSLIKQLADPIKNLRPSTNVLVLKRVATGWQIRLDGDRTLEAENLILATGRFGTQLVGECLPLEARKLLRLEVGVRIEQPTAKFFLAKHEQLDPKYIWRSDDGSVEWRTFCCCRDGLVAWTQFGKFGSVSGRADCDPTGRSNVGFNVRILDHALIESLWPTLSHSIASQTEPIREPLEIFLYPNHVDEMTSLTTMLGPYISRMLTSGLHRLLERFPDLQVGETTLVGPTIEGCGWYPIHNQRLLTPMTNLWVAGDVAGSFRGLTAALVSGYVAGSAVIQGRLG
jgi:uncharacterized FAD-dependent dehydrogenase